MIKTWTLDRFKSVYEQAPLDIAPLTIFAGANSSGKSTVIQSILLTAQTLQSPVQSRPVILNGHIVRLGAFDDVITNGTLDGEIVVGFSLIPSNDETDFMPTNLSRSFYYRHMYRRAREIKSVRCKYSFSARGESGEFESLQLQPRLERSELEVQYYDGENDATEEVVIVRAHESQVDRALGFGFDSGNKGIELQALAYEVEKPSEIRSLRTYLRTPDPDISTPVGATTSHFIPGRIAVRFDKLQAQSRLLAKMIAGEPADYDAYADAAAELSLKLKALVISALRKLARKNDATPALQKRIQQSIQKLDQSFNARTLTEILSHGNVRNRLAVELQGSKSDLEKAARGDSPPQYAMSYVPLPDMCDVAADYVAQYFSRNVKYLGPLRDEPKSVYPLAGAVDPREVGFRGEHTAAVLDVHRMTVVSYIPSRIFSDSDAPLTQETVPLISAVSDWLQYMGVLSDVRTVDRGKLGHELKVTTEGVDFPTDLTHVGVGVSQVLPILVMCLLASPGSTLILEQPELHLHPRVQTRLADFFISMIRTDRQCIVETHSEYMINRLRYRTALSDGNSLSNDINIYFVEKAKDRSNYRLIKINKFGVIEDWPKGFFDENEQTASAVLRAGMDKRKREVESKHA